MNRRLQNKFADADKLAASLKESATADANGNISVDQLKTFVLATVEDDLI